MIAAAAVAEVWPAVLGLASLSVVTTWIGVVLAVRVGRKPAVLGAGIGFSAGIMIIISAVELLPQAYRSGGAATVVGGATLAVASMALLHAVIPHTHLVDETHEKTAIRFSSAYLVAFGLILHDLPEGFAMATSYLANPGLGVLVAIAIAVHNIPEEFAMALPAVALGRRLFLVRAAVASALAEPAGALIGLAGVEIYPSLNAAFLAVAAGAMIFVSAHELFPMARRLGRFAYFAAGAAAAVPLYALLHALTS